jgi:hypothetical protein
MNEAIDMGPELGPILDLDGVPRSFRIAPE